MQKRTIYTLPKDTEPIGEVIAQAIKDNRSVITTFKKLESYVDDDPRMDRAAPTDLLAIHNFADYIVSVNTGYMLGNPVDYSALDKDDIDPIIENYRHQNVYDVDSDLGEDCSMFGQAFENIYTDEDGIVRSAKLSPYNTIVVYDDTFKHDKLFAIYYAPVDRASESYDVTIWTPLEMTTGTLKGNVLTENARVPHYAEDVPVIHFFNNKRLKGDYEPVITLIDAYNILQSDRVLDREKLVDAILAFMGIRATDEDMQNVKDNRIIGLPADADAKYITKNIDEADADVLRKTLAADIHKFSKTPDLTDETFGNSPSGVSILYKLLAFEQNVKKKERQFEAGLRERFAIYSTLLNKAGKLTQKVDVDNVNITFKRALPKNDFETSQMINNLEGVVDTETLISQLSFVPDASVSMEKVKAEQASRLPAGFGSDQFTKE